MGKDLYTSSSLLLSSKMTGTGYNKSVGVSSELNGTQSIALETISSYLSKDSVPNTNELKSLLEELECVDSKGHAVFNPFKQEIRIVDGRPIELSDHCPRDICKKILRAVYDDFYDNYNGGGTETA